MRWTGIMIRFLREIEVLSIGSEELEWTKNMQITTSRQKE